MRGTGFIEFFLVFLFSGQKKKKSAPREAIPPLHLLDAALRGPEVDRVGRRHVEGLGFAIETGTFGGHAQAALAGGDDFCNELFAVYTDLHGDPVLC